MISQAVVDKIFALETELETVLVKVQAEMLSLREENEFMKNEIGRLTDQRDIETKWKSEASEILLLQRETLREFQRKYRRALLYADELQKRLKAI